ncbi:hypothetical protein H6P81_004318 [Aristolochia fimbriata]|uniref:CAAX amino terminal protease n=1 Tax=Aristolochia fimbriata TaxID=158543 RepID=A0AAV7FF25_ARIFI|nr:hypothetical protein H6P81_004318 [Aristolochia fimbriata]
MNFRLSYPHPRLQPSFPSSGYQFFPRATLRTPEFRVWKKRRLKSRRNCSVPGRVEPVAFLSNFDGLFHNLVSLFPSLNSLELIPPLLGFASAGALVLSSRRKEAETEESVIGEWILVSSPTPFNRFVLLRCPSISFQEAELLEGVNERLMKEERHFVNWDMGKIRAADVEKERSGFEEKLIYQRVCIGTEDGGVISLDWPASLDLAKEQGLDTTLLLVPGTAEGSMDTNIRCLVREALKCGYFPVVMNPRGSAGSPLTTARLFSAADSGDIATTIQFISKSRPWSTLMGIGWGYGANMLTKYLGEVAERTPLTAAACIDNPFDLEEATRSYPYRINLDKKLTGGLVDILRANKELFQGKSKGFKVQDGLSATSVRGFEEAISMISYGCNAIEEFYSLSGTRQLVGNVKIPVFFIQQSDDGTVPLFSVPRNSISENPYTSLLLCSCLPPNTVTRERSAAQWCLNLVIEWLAAVELALLKGRHPLLKDVDITINPSNGLALIDARSSDGKISMRNDIRSTYYSKSSLLSDNNESLDAFLNQSDVLNGLTTDHIKDMVEASDVKVQDKTTSYMGPRMHLQNQRVRENLEPEVMEQEEPQRLDDGDLVREGEDSFDVESGQVVQTAEVVMNMLDVTMPNTLSEDQKKKVLTAVGQGETLMKALQEAVPDDVRGKLTAAVADIVRTKKENLKLQGLKHIEPASDVVMDNSQSKTAKVVNVEEGPGEHQKENQKTEAEKQSAEDQPVIKEESHIQKNEPTSKQGKPSPESESETPSSSALSSGDATKMQKDEIESHINEEKNVQVNNQSSSVKAEESSSPPSVPPEPPQISVSQALDALTGFDDSTQMAVNSVFGVIENMIDHLEKETDHDSNGNDDKDETSNLAPESPSTGEDESKLRKGDADESNAESRTIDSEEKPVEDHHISESHQNSEIQSNEKKPSQTLNSSFTNTVAGSEGNEVGFSQMRHKFSSSDVDSTLTGKNMNKVMSGQSLPLYVTINPYPNLPYKGYVSKLFPPKVSNTLDLDTTNSLFLEYFPEEGEWKVLDQLGLTGESTEYSEDKNETGQSIQTPSDKIIEPSYVILDDENEGELSEECETLDDFSVSGNGSVLQTDGITDISILAKDTVLDALKVEVGRRLGVPDTKSLEPDLAHDLEEVAGAVALSCTVDEKLDGLSDCKDSAGEKLQGQHIVEVISEAVQKTTHLRKILPLGVIVGSILAALREHFHDVAPNDDVQTVAKGQGSKCVDQSHVLRAQAEHSPPGEYKDQAADLDALLCGGKAMPEIEHNKNESVMVGALTAALGASALITQQKPKELTKPIKDTEGSFSHAHDKSYSQQEHGSHEVPEDRNQNSLVTSLAEKAMSVAAPVVPTKSDGEVDQEKLVAMLADLGQKGGILRLVGKIALLWGGIRGAMSLTDRLISFLHIAERPLYQRILGFASMVLVVWSPVVVPFLPTLVHNWTAHSPSGIAAYACILGLYTSIMILVVQWGKRIRGYEYPLEQYGLEMTLPSMLYDFLKGLIGGVMLILSIHGVNTSLGFAHFVLPIGLPPSSEGIILWLKVIGKILLLVARGIVPAIGVAIVEELLFRSWLLEEISVDLGYHRAIIISGLAFSLLQRSLSALPGLLLLSLALAGIKERKHGKLSVPIGLRVGGLITTFVLQTGGFLVYRSNAPFWATGTHPWQPFGGAVGLSFCILLAALYCPRQPRNKETSQVTGPKGRVID